LTACAVALFAAAYCVERRSERSRACLASGRTCARVRCQFVGSTIPDIHISSMGRECYSSSITDLFVEMLRAFVAKTSGKGRPQGILMQARLGDPANEATRPPLAKVLGQPSLRNDILNRQSPARGCALVDRLVGGFTFLRCGTPARHLFVAASGSLSLSAAIALGDDNTNNAAAKAPAWRIVLSFDCPACL
jgi:hypothetical protein